MIATFKPKTFSLASVIHLNWLAKIELRGAGGLWSRDGTGQDFLDPTGKFQNHRR